jgi:hypothetical protein
MTALMTLLTLITFTVVTIPFKITSSTLVGGSLNTTLFMLLVGILMLWLNCLKLKVK